YKRANLLANIIIYKEKEILTNRIHKYQTIVFTLVLLLFGGSVAFAQEEDQDPYENVVQLSGIVLGSDSTNGVPGVHIFSPKSGRGTTSNVYGYFSVPMLKGDSVIVSAIGYERKSFYVPENKGNSVSVIIELNEDTTYLEEIQVFPYPTEELFKEAVLALELPYADDLNSLDNIINEEYRQRLLYQIEPSPSTNHRFFTEQQFQAVQNRFMVPANPLLNPLAWSRFIKSLKRGDYKRKD
ncbi:MAG: carboxypeptidase-like regulatory domain-containing protein, partial [Cyclobacteriaceae bacterium]